MTSKFFIAFDLGATSGRTILGELTDDRRITMQELTRFPNRMMPLDGHLYWNIYSLYEELIRGLKEVSRLGVVPTSIGIDTWGVDYVCVGPDGNFIGLQYAYRDVQDYRCRRSLLQGRNVCQRTICSYRNTASGLQYGIPA